MFWKKPKEKDTFKDDVLDIIRLMTHKIKTLELDVDVINARLKKKLLPKKDQEETENYNNSMFLPDRCL